MLMTGSTWQTLGLVIVVYISHNISKLLYQFKMDSTDNKFKVSAAFIAISYAYI